MINKKQLIKERIKVKILKEVLSKSELGYAKDALDYIFTLEKQLAIQRVTSCFDLEKSNRVIELIKNAECEDEIYEAIALKEELNWFAVTDDIKDLWNEYFGDAKKYLP